VAKLLEENQKLNKVVAELRASSELMRIELLKKSK
jgi:hypothetical protein